MSADTTLPPDAIPLLEALEEFAFRLRPVEAELILADGSRENISITEEFCRDHPYGHGVLTPLDFNDCRVRGRLQGLIIFRESNPSDPFPVYGPPEPPSYEFPEPTTDQELWDDVILEVVRLLREGRLQAWGRCGTPWGSLIRIPPDAWTAILPQDVDWSRGSVPDRGLFSIMVTDKLDTAISSKGGDQTVKAVKGRRGRKPALKDAMMKVLSDALGDPEVANQLRAMSENDRRRYVGQALGLPEDEWPGRSWCDVAWEEALRSGRLA